MTKIYIPILTFLLLIFSGCESNRIVVNDIDEREANEIVVFLASRGVSAQKVPAATSPGVGGTSNASMWSIAVEEGKMTEAMALLNQNGLPRKKGTNLLDLFAKQGLMSSEKEESIRYQAGLEQQIANTIRKIDGVLDADVQLSFPTSSTGGPLAQQQTQRTTAAVYVKHTGIVDDPNSHLVPKIKRLVSGSVTGLDINDVTVISDRSKFAELGPVGDTLEASSMQMKDYVKVWSIVMTKDSSARFRVLFFLLTAGNLILILLLGWMVWKFYPLLRENGGFKQMLSSVPFKLEPPKPGENKE